MPQAKIGVIGGSGLYQMEGMTDVEEVEIQTPFGNPSDAITIGNVEGVPMAFLPRHGRGHRISPTEIPVRANIWALKSLGVEWVISVSAVGSLREDIAPRDLVIPDQLFDRTKSRVNSFFEGGIVVHVTFAEPFCPTLSGLLLESARELGDVKVHQGGAYVCIEGPLFSTKAESNVYRSWGMDIIGMTALPEAKLAREAELCYATIACATDYDCWHESEESVTVEMVIGNLGANIANAQRILRSVAKKIPAERSANACECPTSLATAIMTDHSRIPADVKQRYDLLIGKYL
ncbi:MAG TPA: S-methyl-5'-thioadenosine phosphorylase [Ktedonobacteraceae bacterium]|nr:S-methyl-5'-thioadenosine phosphorylase [Ktedonobacteraceae bacterium]